MKTALRTTLVSVVSLLLVFTVAAVPAQASESWSHSAVIKNSSYSAASFRAYRYACSNTAPCPGSPSALIKPGSKTSWYDADMIYIGSGYSVIGPTGVPIQGPRYVKVYGCGHCTKTYKVVKVRW